MKTVNEILSKVVLSVGDESYQRFGRAVYVDAFQRVLEALGSEVFAWQNEMKFLVTHVSPDQNPPLSTNAAAVNFNIDPITLAPSNLVINFTSQPSASRAINYTPEIKHTRTLTIPAGLCARYIMRVTRDNKECKEYTLDAIQRTYYGNLPFNNNDWQLPYNTFATRVNPDETTDLVFSERLNQDEEIYVSFISGRPFIARVITDTFAVSDWVAEAIQYGVEKTIFSLMFNRGDNEAKSRMDNASNEYTKAKYDAIAYSRNLYDRRSTLELQPLKFLSDYKNYYSP